MEQSRPSRFTDSSSEAFDEDDEFEELQEAVRLSLTCDASGDYDDGPSNSAGVALEKSDHNDGLRFDEFLTRREAGHVKLLGEENLIEDEERDLNEAIRLSLLQETSGSDFKYDPLSSHGDFRLLFLDLHQKAAHGIEFRLMKANLDADVIPPYTTLSYSWGETFADGSHLTHTITCGGKLLRITHTLHQALCRILETRRRHTLESRMLLWVDGICINQQDVNERQSQVDRMADIYKGCSSMIIWLGEHSDNTVEYLKRLNRITTSQTSGLTLRRDLTLSRDEIQEELIYLVHNAPIELSNIRQYRLPHPLERLLPKTRTGPGVKRGTNVANYTDFLARAWFKRKWVIQEVAQTYGKDRSFLIADKVFAFNDLEADLRRISLMDSFSPLQARSDSGTLLSNLARYRSTLSSDSHDHVYALKGLSTDSSWLPVDYTIGADELYAMVASYYIRNGCVVAVLALASIKSSAGRLPTWVPDWRESDFHRCTAQIDALNTLAIQDQRLFGSKDSSASDVNIPLSDPQRLNLKAWVVRSCTCGDLHDENTCINCLLLRQEVRPLAVSNDASSEPLSKGKAPATASTPPPNHQSLLSTRRVQAHMKWGARIREQFEEIMYREEVLCLLEGSPFGFVLWPVGGKSPTGDFSSFTLGYCFQVDEEGWASDWFGGVLGEARREWISLV